VSLRQSELAALATEFTRELVGGVIQDVHAPTTTRAYLELRVPGRSAVLLVCADLQVARISAVEKRPANPATPPAWQSVLRRELTGAKLTAVEALPKTRCLLWSLTKGPTERFLAFESTGTPGVALTTGEKNILCLSIPFRKGLRVGGPWSPEEAPDSEAPSRLRSDFEHLRLAHGAEALFGEVEQHSWLKAKKVALEHKLQKLERTQAKVRSDAARLDGAHDFQREGTLLAQNLFRLERGQRSVTLTEYTTEGEAVERVIALDPKRSLKEEVEWRFHQYRRLVRGAQMAQTRLAVLAQEEAVVRAALAAVDAAPPEAPAVPIARVKKQQPASLPYKEYAGHAGHRILVGRGSKQNDALTFQVARPFHLWLHARGVPGAHVVVPLEKNEVISSELLIDAAHLALHHSDLKGEPSGEVSSVPVKFVRKAGAPGAVTYTREKTIMVRVQPERLQRLLATEHNAGL
jgi:predicted ribosome quality control (RQC) complex YloA/Tae2 family protein